MSNTQSLAGTNHDFADNGFPSCVVFWMEKSHIYCANTIVFGRLLKMDCPKHSLKHCLMGLFGWMNPALL